MMIQTIVYDKKVDRITGKSKVKRYAKEVMNCPKEVFVELSNKIDI